MFFSSTKLSETFFKPQHFTRWQCFIGSLSITCTNVSCYSKSTDLVSFQPSPWGLPSNWFWLGTGANETEKHNRHKTYSIQQILIQENNVVVVFITITTLQYLWHYKKRYRNNRPNKGDPCKSDFVDTTCFPQLWKIWAYVPTVSNKITRGPVTSNRAQWAKTLSQYNDGEQTWLLQTWKPWLE